MATMEEASSATVTKDVERSEETVENSRAPTIPQAHPWLLIHHGKEYQCQTFYSISNQCCYKREIPELSNKFICNSSVNGWLLVEHLNSDDFFLYNPFSVEKIGLPQLEQPYSICILTSDPSDPQCLVLFVSECGKSVMFCHPGEEAFDEQVLGEEITCATSVQGKIYCFVVGKGLALLDFSGPRLCLVYLICEFPYISFSRSSLKFKKFMVESDGEPLVVYKHYYGFFHLEVLGFSIYRPDLSLKKWVKVEDIGDRAIFLDTRQGVCLSTTTEEESSSSIKGNSIYFVEPDDTRLYVFDLDVEKTVGCLPSSQVSSRHSEFSWLVMSS